MKECSFKLRTITARGSALTWSLDVETSKAKLSNSVAGLDPNVISIRDVVRREVIKTVYSVENSACQQDTLRNDELILGIEERKYIAGAHLENIRSISIGDSHRVALNRLAS